MQLQQLLQDFFNGKKLNKSLVADEAAAIGASSHAAVLTGSGGPSTQNLLLLDASTVSFGIRTAGGVMTRIISRNTTIPCKKQEIFTTYSDNQTSVLLMIYEGMPTYALSCLIFVMKVSAIW